MTNKRQSGGVEVTGGNNCAPNSWMKQTVGECEACVCVCVGGAGLSRSVQGATEEHSVRNATYQCTKKNKQKN